jgi:Subtilase family
MSSRIFALTILGVLTGLSAVSAVGPSQPMVVRPRASGNALLHVSGSRSLQQRHSAGGSKFDAALAEISRNLGRVRPEHAMEDLIAMNPAVKFSQPDNVSTPLVLIDATTKGDAQQLKTALVGLGLQRASQFSNDVSGWLPVNQLDAVSQLGEVHALRAAMMHTRGGAVTTQGDFAQNSDLVRSQNSLNGAGVTVGALSDSYNCYAQFAANGVAASGNAGYASNGFLATAANDTTSGDLPATVNVLEEATCFNPGTHQYIGFPLQLPPGDEGRAMLQIVHDVAPGAALAFHTANEGEADFANGILALATAGAKIIIDDVGYFDEPFFQDGIVAQAITTVKAQGVAFFTSAGNNGTLAYNNTAPIFGTVSTVAPNVGEHLMNFDTIGGTTNVNLPVTLPKMAPGDFVAIVVEWDQPYVTGAPLSGGATSAIDLCVTNVMGNDDITDDNLKPLPGGCTGPNALHQDPTQTIIIGNPANAAGNSGIETFNINLGLVSGATPGRIKVSVEGDGLQLTINQFATNSGTIQGHSSSADAMSVGAAFFANTPSCGQSPAVLEYFSSAGGDPILFDSAGTRLAVPVFRQKPDLVGPDGGNNTFLGFQIAGTGITDTSTVSGCQNNANFPNFFGTSAAAPHVASIAALMLQADPGLTPTQIYSILQQTAAPIGNKPTAVNPNYAAGYGFVQADKAAGITPVIIPNAPSLSLAASSIVTGSSTTITWSSANTTGCTASGSWTGALASNGSQTVSPTAVGTDTYTLACANGAGPSLPTSVTLSVTTAPPTQPASSGGGGGSLQLSTLLALAGLSLAQAWRIARSRRRALTRSAG